MVLQAHPSHFTSFYGSEQGDAGSEQGDAGTVPLNEVK